MTPDHNSSLTEQRLADMKRDREFSLAHAHFSERAGIRTNWFFFQHDHVFILKMFTFTVIQLTSLLLKMMRLWGTDGEKESGLKHHSLANHHIFYQTQIRSVSRNGARCVSSTSFGPKSAPKTKFWGKWLRDPTTRRGTSKQGTSSHYQKGDLDLGFWYCICICQLIIYKYWDGNAATLPKEYKWMTKISKE